MTVDKLIIKTLKDFRKSEKPAERLAYLKYLEVVKQFYDFKKITNSWLDEEVKNFKVYLLL